MEVEFESKEMEDREGEIDASSDGRWEED